MVWNMDALMVWACVSRPVLGWGVGTTLLEIHEVGCGRVHERDDRPKAKAECCHWNKRGNDTGGKNKVCPPPVTFTNALLQMQGKTFPSHPSPRLGDEGKTHVY